MVEKKDKIRVFRRCKTDQPVDITINELAFHESDYLNDISLNGLSFKSKFPMQNGKMIDIVIPLTYPVFQTVGEVVWCRQEGVYYNIGVKFVVPGNSLTAEAVTQVCEIDEYKKEIALRTGRKLTNEEAAIEWLKKYIIELKR